MLFNSILFLLFLFLTYSFHWFLFSKSANNQNIFLLISSIIFYGFWDWRFVLLLLLSIVLVFVVGIKIDQVQSDRNKKYWLRFGLLFSIGLLGVFKYFNFFVSSFIDLLNLFNLDLNFKTLSVILPVGISFYTFHGVSYMLDIYYNRIKPTNDFVKYSLFVTYFPLLVAGPIERATHLLPQLNVKRKINVNDINNGLSLILWGFFKKIAVADSLGMIVDLIFNDVSHFSSFTLIFGAILFAFQIYADFSGYTDIARGVSRFFGIHLLLNFNFPYFSKSIPEFWSRWHISLSSFLNDYVFIPLALYFRGYNKWGIFVSIFFTFLISGIWHGAGWNFVLWGILHAFYYLPLFLNSKTKVKSIINLKTNDSSILNAFFKQLRVFSLVVFALIFFRSNNISDAFNYLSTIYSGENPFSLKELTKTNTHLLVLIKGLFSVLLMMLFEYYLYKRNAIIENLIIGWVRIVIIFILLILLGSFENTVKFIYFQF